MARVVDTDVFSYFLKDDTRADLYKRHTNDQFLIVSFMTVAELEKWSLRAKWGAQLRGKFDKTLRRYHVSYPTRKACEIWAQVSEDGRRTGKNIAHADAWIAATALYFDVPLVTHNSDDYKHVGGLNLISER